MASPNLLANECLVLRHPSEQNFIGFCLPLCFETNTRPQKAHTVSVIGFHLPVVFCFSGAFAIRAILLGLNLDLYRTGAAFSATLPIATTTTAVTRPFAGYPSLPATRYTLHHSFPSRFGRCLASPLPFKFPPSLSTLKLSPLAKSIPINMG